MLKVEPCGMKRSRCFDRDGFFRIDWLRWNVYPTDLDLAELLGRLLCLFLKCYATAIMIVAENLVFDYPEKRALRGLNFCIQRGAIVALVGPNGAGKTTLIRCLVGLARLNQGRVLIDGMDIHDSPRVAHRRVGYLGDRVGLYDGLSVRRCLMHSAAAAGIPVRDRRARLCAVIERLGLGNHLDALAGQLSGGQRQRLAIAQAIIHEPEFLVLDEPASGLDPEARSRLSKLIVSLRDDGATILVSSHILAELEDYCTEMLVIDDGQLVDAHRPKNLGTRFRIVLASLEPDFIVRIGAIDGVASVTAQSHTEAIIALVDGKVRPEGVLRSMVMAGIPVCSFGPEQWRLQDSYLATLDGTRGLD